MQSFVKSNEQNVVSADLLRLIYAYTYDLTQEMKDDIRDGNMYSLNLLLIHQPRVKVSDVKDFFVLACTNNRFEIFKYLQTKFRVRNYAELAPVIAGNCDEEFFYHTLQNVLGSNFDPFETLMKGIKNGKFYVVEELDNSVYTDYEYIFEEICRYMTLTEIFSYISKHPGEITNTIHKHIADIAQYVPYEKLHGIMNLFKDQILGNLNEIFQHACEEGKDSRLALNSITHVINNEWGEELTGVDVYSHFFDMCSFEHKPLEMIDWFYDNFGVYCWNNSIEDFEKCIEVARNDPDTFGHLIRAGEIHGYDFRNFQDLINNVLSQGETKTLDMFKEYGLEITIDMYLGLIEQFNNSSRELHNLAFKSLKWLLSTGKFKITGAQINLLKNKKLSESFKRQYTQIFGQPVDENVPIRYRLDTDIDEPLSPAELRATLGYKISADGRIIW